ncbi:MAG: hypothetical protein IT180_17430 [Acidobacteria bacterium]|nr:hypothetical protein [Acidobacteriota bacterium]
MAAPIGLLLVHGIGRQQRGETLGGFLGGLRLACGARLDVRIETGGGAETEARLSVLPGGARRDAREGVCGARG